LYIIGQPLGSGVVVEYGSVVFSVNDLLTLGRIALI